MLSGRAAGLSVAPWIPRGSVEDVSACRVGFSLTVNTRQRFAGQDAYAALKARVHGISYAGNS